jgi:hypothetical protein
MREPFRASGCWPQRAMVLGGDRVRRSRVSRVSRFLEFRRWTPQVSFLSRTPPTPRVYIPSCARPLLSTSVFSTLRTGRRPCAAPVHSKSVWSLRTAGRPARIVSYARSVDPMTVFSLFSSLLLGAYKCIFLTCAIGAYTSVYSLHTAVDYTTVFSHFFCEGRAPLFLSLVPMVVLARCLGVTSVFSFFFCEGRAPLFLFFCRAHPILNCLFLLRTFLLRTAVALLK